MLIKISYPLCIKIRQSTNSISKLKARLDKYTCFISLYAGKPAQQENLKTS